MAHIDMASYDKIWEIIHKALKEKYPPDLMNLWLSKLELVYLDENRADFVIPEQLDFFVKIINSNYAQSISNAFYEKLNMNVDVKIYSRESYSNIKKDENIVQEKNDIVITENKNQEKSFIDNNYHSEYTFDNFIVGSSNKFAYNACLSITSELTSNYNPLFIYGDSGLGKTHLMKAIVNRLNKTKPDLNIIFVTAERFMNEFITAIREKQTTKFKEKYRNTDVLLIDDIQYIEGANETQIEFFHTFNELYENHKQVILTSDKAPKYLKELTSRLQTRFEGGLIVDIQPPDTELKIAILQSKAREMNISISNEIIVYIVENVSGSIRKLEGIIKRLGAYSYINNKQNISLDVAKQVIEPYVEESQKPDEIANKIISTVSVLNDVEIEDMKSQSRKANIVYARNLAIYMIREHTNMSLDSIGKIFGNRDHTTIINSYDRIAREKANNPAVDKTLKDIYKDVFE